MIPNITPAELKQIYCEKENIVLLDVRTREEFLTGHIHFAVHIPIEILEAGRFKPEPGQVLIATCAKGGGRSARAAEYLQKSFNNDVYVLKGGTYAWFGQE